MIGDKLVIKAKHRKAAAQIIDVLLPKIQNWKTIYRITVAGESGSGKSETAQALADKLAEHEITCAILQQDDYFVYPPKTNDRARRDDINWVGMQEVRLDLMDEHLQAAKAGVAEIIKPLVIYQEDRITEERVSFENTKAVIAEGTYTTALRNVDTRIFIDLTYLETKKARLERAREAQDDFLEKVLKIEHEIISDHKKFADILIKPDFDITLTKNDSR